MKPYTVTLTLEEWMTLGAAVHKGRWYVEHAINPSASADEIEMMKKADQFMDAHAIDGGYESEAESKAASIKKFAEDCAKYGSD